MSSESTAREFLTRQYGKYKRDHTTGLTGLIDAHVEKEMAKQRDVIIGNGDVVVTDIHNDEYGWAGICFSRHDCPVGEVYDTDAKTDVELGAFMRIVTSNTDSLNVVIAACERAKSCLNAVEKSDE